MHNEVSVQLVAMKDIANNEEGGVMSVQEIKRPLSELEARAGIVRGLPCNLRLKIIDLAGEKSPSATFGLAEAMLRNSGCSEQEVEQFAKAARWLAIILRDYGREEFNRITA